MNSESTPKIITLSYVGMAGHPPSSRNVNRFETSYVSRLDGPPKTVEDPLLLTETISEDLVSLNYFKITHYQAHNTDIIKQIFLYELKNMNLCKIPILLYPSSRKGLNQQDYRNMDRSTNFQGRQKPGGRGDTGPLLFYDVRYFIAFTCTYPDTSYQALPL